MAKLTVLFVENKENLISKKTREEVLMAVGGGEGGENGIPKW